jgi:hypothetical protein
MELGRKQLMVELSALQQWLTGLSMRILPWPLAAKSKKFAS